MGNMVYGTKRLLCPDNIFMDFYHIIIRSRSFYYKIATSAINIGSCICNFGYLIMKAIDFTVNFWKRIRENYIKKRRKMKDVRNNGWG